MKRHKLPWVNRIAIAYYITIVTTYAAGISYWQWYSNKYDTCAGNAYYCTSMIEPDGPMGLNLFILIPLGVTLLFSLLFICFWIIIRNKNRSRRL